MTLIRGAADENDLHGPVNEYGEQSLKGLKAQWHAHEAPLEVQRERLEEPIERPERYLSMRQPIV